MDNLKENREIMEKFLNMTITEHGESLLDILFNMLREKFDNEYEFKVRSYED